MAKATTKKLKILKGRKNWAEKLVAIHWSEGISQICYLNKGSVTSSKGQSSKSKIGTIFCLRGLISTTTTTKRLPKETGNCDSYTGEKSSHWEKFSHVRLSKDFKEAILNMFKTLKEGLGVQSQW